MGLGQRMGEMAVCVKFSQQYSDSRTGTGTWESHFMAYLSRSPCTVISMCILSSPSPSPTVSVNTSVYKKVLLRGRKRHTPPLRSKCSICCPIPGGDPIPVQGVPLPWPGGYSPGKGPGTSHWGTPRKDMGPVEVLWDGDGVPPERTGPVEVLWDGDEVNPPPPPPVWTDKQTETTTFPHPLDAGGKYWCRSRSLHCSSFV